MFLLFCTIIIILLFWALVTALIDVVLYRRFVRESLGRASYSFGSKDVVTQLDKCLKELADTNDGLGYEKNAIALLKGNLESFAARIITAKMAGRSLDMMYYIFEDDKVGKLLLAEILSAANRGVRVRLLIDDINVGRRDVIFHALDRHPNIEIRIFNPCRSRKLSIKRIIEFTFRALTITRRMHNKAYIADGRVAIVGGRNIADNYLGVSSNANARDLDVMLVGPAVSEAEDIFDAYWNSEVSLPIGRLVVPVLHMGLAYWEVFLSNYINKDEIRRLLKEIYNISFSYFLRVNLYLIPIDEVRVIADPPEKALRKCSRSWLVNFLFSCIVNAKDNIQITSPYFVPGEIGSKLLKQLASRGVDVKILTNSLATTDVAVAYSGYLPYRKGLLQAGVKIFELKRSPSYRLNLKRHTERNFNFLVRKPASLHTKAFLIDGKKAFVGSFNFDMRSVSLNTEMGVYFVSDNIAAHMDLLFNEEISPHMSYELALNEEEKVCWLDREFCQTRQYLSEPMVKSWKRWLVRMIRLLPIESQL